MNNTPDSSPHAEQTAPASPGEALPSPARRKSGGGSALLSRLELAKALGLSTRSVDRLAASRKIPTIRTGRLVRFRLDRVLDALDKNATREAI